jgi:hypothetical protein
LVAGLAAGDTNLGWYTVLVTKVEDVVLDSPLGAVYANSPCNGHRLCGQTF